MWAEKKGTSFVPFVIDAVFFKTESNIKQLLKHKQERLQKDNIQMKNRKGTVF